MSLHTPDATLAPRNRQQALLLRIAYRRGIRHKLVGSFVILLVLMTTVVLLINLVNTASRDKAREIDHHQQVVDEFNDVLWSVSQMQTSYRSYLMFGETALLGQYNNAYSRFQGGFESLKQDVLLSPDQFGRIVSLEQDIWDWRNDIINPGLRLRGSSAEGSNDDEAALEYLQTRSGLPLYQTITQQLQEGLAYEERIIVDLERDAGQLEQLQTVLIVGGIVVVILAGVGLSVLLARDIGGAVEGLGRQAKLIAMGDLHVRINSDRTDEVGQAAMSFDEMANQLERRTSELREAATMAEERERRLRTIVDNVAEGLISFNLEGHVTSFNPAARTMFASTDDYMTGTCMLDLLRERCTGAHLRLEDLLPADGDGPVVLREADGVRTNGETFPVEVLIQEIPDRESREFMSVIRDVSERHRAEQLLRERVRAAQEAESKTRAVLDASGDAIVVASDDAVVVQANQPFADFFQAAKHDVLGLSTEEILQAASEIVEDIDHVTRLVRRGLENPDDRVVDAVTVVWPERRELEYSSMPVLMPDGERLGRLYAFRDITHQREIERMKNDFVSLVSHELRTPMTSIKGYVDLLLDEDAGTLTEDQREFLHVVRNNVQRLVAMVNELLDISRIESGKMDLHLSPVDLHPVVDRVAMELSPLIERKHQDLSVHAASDLRPAVADEDRLGLIVMNLLSNAVKYTAEGGQITVNMRNEGENVLIDVTDTGVGLTESELGKLFTRFYRASNRETRAAAGSGLGLSITKSLVEMHGGTISVKSTPGEGSTFTVMLPAAEVDAPTTLPAIEEPAQGGNILLVEDDVDIANLISHYLTRSGHTVKIASDAAAARESIRSMSFDLVTLDIVLPDLDGYSLLQELLEATEGAVPIMMLSMLPDDGSSKEFGAADYVLKPVQEEDLLERISRILRGNRHQTVLVADDDVELRRVIVRELQRLGHRTIEAADGLQATERAHGQQIDLILLDVRMPRMDGMVTLQALRSSEVTRDIPVIMMTGDDRVLSQRSSGVSPAATADVLSKTSSPRDIASMIHKVLEAQGVSGT